jgi:hypothetical protein
MDKKLKIGHSTVHSVEFYPLTETNDRANLFRQLAGVNEITFGSADDCKGYGSIGTYLLQSLKNHEKR